MTGDKRCMSRHDKILNKKSEKAPLAWRYTKNGYFWAKSR